MIEQVTDKIVELLREQVGWTVHWGDPTTNPQWNLPYVAVAPVRDAEAVWTTGRNKGAIEVAAFVVVGIADNFRSADLDSPMDRQLVQQAEKVKAVLRGKVTLEGLALTYNSITVQFRTGVRGSEGIRVAQVNVSFEVGRIR